MKKYTISSIIIVILIIAFTVKVQATTGKVTTETLNLRSKASTDSSVVKLLNMDDELEILSEEGNWYKVKVGNSEGYVSKDYVKVDKNSMSVSTGKNNTTNTTNDTITSNNDSKSNANTTSSTTSNNNDSNHSETTSNVTPNSTLKLEKDVTIKILPLINSNNLGTAKAGDEVTVITTANNWLFIETNEIAGWIVKDSSVGQVINSGNSKTDENKDSSTSNVENKDNSSNSNSGNTENKSNSSNDNSGSAEGKDTSSSNTAYTKTTKYVNTSSVYVRKEPSTSASIVTTLIKNTDVTVVGESGDWYKITFKDYSGYIYKELLSDKKTE